MKLLVTIVGTRPQLVKVASVSKEIRKYHKEILVNTGQHYDYGLNKIFFEHLNIPEPDYNLNVGSGSHSEQTGKMIIGLGEVLLKEKPDFVTIFVDTNTTLAAAITAAKLNIPLGHIEAGVRNFNMCIPEEVNRVVADQLSTLLFAPTETAVDNLVADNMFSKTYFTGDVMYDTFLQNIEAAEHSCVLEDLNLEKRSYILSTIHRPNNTEGKRLFQIIEALNKQKTVLALHPRTKLDKKWENIMVTKPQGYLDFLKLMKYAKKVVTDSGGVQKEAYWLGVPCITVYDSTPWPETIGWNTLAEPEDICRLIDAPAPANSRILHWGNGDASQQIVDIINKSL